MTIISPEEREDLRKLIMAYQIRPEQTEGMKSINEILTRLLDALEDADRRAAQFEQERDAIIIKHFRLEALIDALTPSAATKAAYMSEVCMMVDDIDEDGEPVERKVFVSWDAIKDIMKMIREYAGEAEQAKEGSPCTKP